MGGGTYQQGCWEGMKVKGKLHTDESLYMRGASLMRHFPFLGCRGDAPKGLSYPKQMRLLHLQQ